MVDRRNRHFRELEAVLKCDGRGVDDGEMEGRAIGTAVGCIAGGVASVLTIIGFVIVGP